MARKTTALFWIALVAVLFTPLFALGVRAATTQVTGTTDVRVETSYQNRETAEFPDFGPADFERFVSGNLDKVEGHPENPLGQRQTNECVSGWAIPTERPLFTLEDQAGKGDRDDFIVTLPVSFTLQAGETGIKLGHCGKSGSYGSVEAWGTLTWSHEITTPEPTPSPTTPPTPTIPQVYKVWMPAVYVQPTTQPDPEPTPQPAACNALTVTDNIGRQHRTASTQAAAEQNINVISVDPGVVYTLTVNGDEPVERLWNYHRFHTSVLDMVPDRKAYVQTSPASDAVHLEHYGSEISNQLIFEKGADGDFYVSVCGRWVGFRVHP